MLVVPVVSLVLAIIASASSFLIIDAEPGLVVVEPGSLVKLSCVVDDDYEYCMWHSPNNKMCDFEWKRHHNNITMQDCPLNENHEKVINHIQLTLLTMIINYGLPLSRSRSMENMMTEHVESLLSPLQKTQGFGSKISFYVY